MTASASGAVPGVRFRRLLLVVTGAASATGMLEVLRALRDGYPQIEVRTLLTTSASHFLTLRSVGMQVGAPALLDAWQPESEEAVHVQLQGWADAAVVYPCSMHYFARLALGLTDSPSLLALHCSDFPIGIAPALPPFGDRSPAYQEHWKRLSDWPNVVLGAPVPARSLTTGRMDAWGPAPLDVLLLEMEARAASGSVGT